MLLLRTGELHNTNSTHFSARLSINYVEIP